MPVTDTEFEELMSIVDRYAGKQHNRQGPVARSLAVVLERHEQMLRANHGMPIGPAVKPSEPPVEEFTIKCGRTYSVASGYYCGLPSNHAGVHHYYRASVPEQG